MHNFGMMFLLLLLSIMMGLSSMNMFMVWIWLELNTMVFLLMIYSNSMYGQMELMVKYFLVQSLSSVMFLFSVFFLMLSFEEFSVKIIFFLSIFMKLGIFPFHLWVLNISKMLDWHMLFVLLTFQKILPLMLFKIMIEMKMYVKLILLMSIIISCVGSFNNSSIRFLMIYSSIFSVTWMIISLMNNFWFYLLMVIYMLMMMPMVEIFNKKSLNFIQQLYVKSFNSMEWLMMTFFFFVMSGLPPFLGFIFKLLIMNCFMMEKYEMLLFMNIFIVSSMWMMYIYLNILNSLLMIMKVSNMMKNNNSKVMMSWVWLIMSLILTMIFLVMNVILKMTNSKVSMTMMSNVVCHPYHLVDESPWPIMSAISALYMTSGLVNMFTNGSLLLLLMGVLMLFMSSYQWWRDISYEGCFQGLHSMMVYRGLRSGMVLFIVSEILFFFSFFWTYFHMVYSPSCFLGMVWPPVGVKVLNPFHVPLLNTLVLLSSGVSVTWAHHSMMEGDHESTKMGLLMTIMLGMYFSLLQGYEYYEVSFSIADSSYGSVFFIATGFHGFHVLVGTMFLLVCYTRQVKKHFSVTHHFGFEAAAWYWHFVDVVWLFLFMAIYWMGSVMSIIM